MNENSELRTSDKRFVHCKKWGTLPRWDILDRWMKNQKWLMRFMALLINIKTMGNKYEFQPFVQEDKYDSVVIIRTWWDDFIFP